MPSRPRALVDVQCHVLEELDVVSQRFFENTNADVVLSFVLSELHWDLCPAIAVEVLERLDVDPYLEVRR